MITPSQTTTSFSVLFSLLIIFASFSNIPQTLLNRPQQTQTQTLTLTPPRNYIVRFNDYKYAADHHSYLRRNINSGDWNWIDRNNPASRFPTDFGVVSIGENGVIEEIEKLSGVKDVFVDFRYSRSVLATEEPEPEPEPESDICGVKKKPGKMFTKMSFEESEEIDSGTHWSSISNQTINWRRNLLGKRSQVTSLFAADVLWSKGCTGISGKPPRIPDKPPEGDRLEIYKAWTEGHKRRILFKIALENA